MECGRFYSCIYSWAAPLDTPHNHIYNGSFLTLAGKEVSRQRSITADMPLISSCFPSVEEVRSCRILLSSYRLACSSTSYSVCSVSLDFIYTRDCLLSSDERSKTDGDPGQVGSPSVPARVCLQWIQVLSSRLRGLIPPDGGPTVLIRLESIHKRNHSLLDFEKRSENSEIAYQV